MSDIKNIQPTSECRRVERGKEKRRNKQNLVFNREQTHNLHVILDFDFWDFVKALKVNWKGSGDIFLSSVFSVSYFPLRGLNIRPPILKGKVRQEGGGVAGLKGERAVGGQAWLICDIWSHLYLYIQLMTASAAVPLIWKHNPLKMQIMHEIYLIWLTVLLTH